MSKQLTLFQCLIKSEVPVKVKSSSKNRLKIVPRDNIIKQKKSKLQKKIQKPRKKTLQIKPSETPMTSTDSTCNVMKLEYKISKQQSNDEPFCETCRTCKLVQNLCSMCDSDAMYKMKLM